MQTGSPYRPSSGRFGATFLQGKATLKRTAHFYYVKPFTPLSQSFGLTAPPTRREPFLRIYKRLGRKFSRRGVAVFFRNFSDFSAAYSHSTLLDMGTTPI